MNFPEDLRYTKEHEWIKIDEEASSEGEIIAIIGITDFAQGELGELVYIEVDTVGESVQKDEVFGTIEAVKTTSDLFMPVTGKILELNPALDENQGDNPGLINESPYVDGWIVKVVLEKTEDLNDLLSAESYQALVS